MPGRKLAPLHYLKVHPSRAQNRAHRNGPAPIDTDLQKETQGRITERRFGKEVRRIKQFSEDVSNFEWQNMQPKKSSYYLE